MGGRFTSRLLSTAFYSWGPKSSPTPKSSISSFPIRQCFKRLRTSCGITNIKNPCFKREVAEYAEINESTYIHYENPEHDYYPIDNLSRIAELLEVDITDLLDEYNQFLYNGQGWQIRKLRKSMGLTQYQFGKLHSVGAGAVKRWEIGRVRVSKGTWERLMAENN